MNGAHRAVVLLHDRPAAPVTAVARLVRKVDVNVRGELPSRVSHPERDVVVCGERRDLEILADNRVPDLQDDAGKYAVAPTVREHSEAIGASLEILERKLVVVVLADPVGILRLGKSTLGRRFVGRRSNIRDSDVFALFARRKEHAAGNPGARLDDKRQRRRRLAQRHLNLLRVRGELVVLTDLGAKLIAARAHVNGRVVRIPAARACAVILLPFDPRSIGLRTVG